MTHVMNMKEVLCMFMTTVIKYHSLSYVIFNAKMTLFDLNLPWPLTPAHNKDISNNAIFALKLHNWANDTQWQLS